MFSLEKAPVCDIGIAPEFVMPQSKETKLCEEYRKQKNVPRMMVAGTGATIDVDSATGFPWNEARVLNSSGAVLWRQRKLWPAIIAKNRFSVYGIDATSDEAHEAYANGDKLYVIDIDTVGRCVILICQDLVCEPIVSMVISEFQPDLVIVPILDGGKFEGRWGHQQEFGLSTEAQTRYLAANSTSFQPSDPLALEECGFCVGPRDPSKKDFQQGRLMATVSPNPGMTFGHIDWDQSKDPRWKKATLTGSVI